MMRAGQRWHRSGPALLGAVVLLGALPGSAGAAAIVTEVRVAPGDVSPASDTVSTCPPAFTVLSTTSTGTSTHFVPTAAQWQKAVTAGKILVDVGGSQSVSPSTGVSYGASIRLTI